MDANNCSMISLTLYKISREREYFTRLQDQISLSSGCRCRLFEDTLLFLSKTEKALKEIEAICKTIGVNVNPSCICHGVWY